MPNIPKETVELQKNVAELQNNVATLTERVDAVRREIAYLHEANKQAIADLQKGRGEVWGRFWNIVAGVLGATVGGVVVGALNYIFRP